MQSYTSQNAQKLDELVGKSVLALVPAMHSEKLVTLKLHTVDDSGIWVEHAEFTQTLLTAAGLDPATPQLIFLPFAQITLLLQPERAAAHHDLWHK